MFDRESLTPKMDLGTHRINLDAFRKETQREKEEKHGYANVLYRRLMDQIIQFQSELKPDEEVGAYLASFGKEIYLHIEQVGYNDPYYILFAGTLANGKKARLVQHVSQISILLIAAQVAPEENREPYRIGFRIDDP